MAKALIGHLHSDLRSSSRLAAQNARLARRVVELESLVLRLQEQNDALLHERAALLGQELERLQPV